MIKVVCAIDNTELPCADMDVLVFPEGLNLASLAATSAKFKEALVVGASRDGQHMRAHVLRHGKNLVDYLKIRSDGRSLGIGVTPRNAITEGPDFALGILVCMDIDDEFRLIVRDRLLASSKRTKLLCIPADMEYSWFSSEPVLGFTGINVALSNNNVTYPGRNDRAKSLIAGTDGKWIVRQAGCEPIVASVA